MHRTIDSSIHLATTNVVLAKEHLPVEIAEHVRTVGRQDDRRGINDIAVNEHKPLDSQPTECHRHCATYSCSLRSEQDLDVMESRV